MGFDFDAGIDRRGSSSTKWEKFDPDVLPMWVADMDFAAPQFILSAIRERLEHPVLGYTDRPLSLDLAFQGWLERHYGWSVEHEWLVWLPGVVPALNLACRTLAGSGQKILIPTPVYHPFLALGANAGVGEIRVPMIVDQGHWSMDLERLQDAVDRETRMLLICNPQNPTGRCYSESEIEALADFVIRNDLVLVSDEIHCNIVLKAGVEHRPLATVCPELEARTISLYAASKVYNIPGVSCAVAVIPDDELRARFLDARAGLVSGIGPLGFAAAEAAFNDQGRWIPDLVEYLRGNWGILKQALGSRLCDLEGTYLAWIDVRDLGINDPEAHFARHGLGISPGQQFEGTGYIRLNFGCSQATLREGIERLNLGIAAAKSSS